MKRATPWRHTCTAIPVNPDTICEVLKICSWLMFVVRLRSLWVSAIIVIWVVCGVVFIVSTAILPYPKTGWAQSCPKAK